MEVASREEKNIAQLKKVQQDTKCLQRVAFSFIIYKDKKNRGNIRLNLDRENTEKAREFTRQFLPLD